MNDQSRHVQRVYLILMLLHTLAASFIWGINTLFLLDAGLSNAQAFSANAFFTAGQVIFEVPTGVIADTVHPVKDETAVDQVLANARLDQQIHRFSPEELYEEATQVLLDPGARTTASVIQASQVDQAVPGDLTLRDSVGIAAGQLIALIGVCVALFVVTYLVFMRQEVRA